MNGRSKKKNEKNVTIKPFFPLPLSLPHRRNISRGSERLERGIGLQVRSVPIESGSDPVT